MPIIAGIPTPVLVNFHVGKTAFQQGVDKLFSLDGDIYESDYISATGAFSETAPPKSTINT